MSLLGGALRPSVAAFRHILFKDTEEEVGEVDIAQKARRVDDVKQCSAIRLEGFS